MDRKIIFIILLIIILYVLYYSINETKNKPPSIEKDDYYYYKTRLNLDNLSPNQKKNLIQNEVLNFLPEGYVFLDYIYYIKGCSLSTFHRDVTSGQKYFNTKHPTYTVIIYEYDGDYLLLCPKSHEQYPFTWNRPIEISGQKYTVVIFNSDMLHCGSINRIGRERKVIQFKVCHREDIEKLKEINSINVDKYSDENIDINVEYFLRFLSFHFSWFINTFSSQLLQKKKEAGFANAIQNIIPISFYNNVKN
jgi:hypothetical protein